MKKELLADIPTGQDDQPDQSDPPTADTGHDSEDIDKTLAEIRSRAKELGLSNEDTENAVADYLASREMTSDPTVSPEIIAKSLSSIEEKLTEAGIKLKDTHLGLENLSEDLNRLFETIHDLVVLIEEYLNKIANETNPETKKVLVAELQQVINKFGL